MSEPIMGRAHAYPCGNIQCQQYQCVNDRMAKNQATVYVDVQSQEIADLRLKVSALELSLAQQANDVFATSERAEKAESLLAEKEAQAKLDAECVSKVMEELGNRNATITRLSSELAEANGFYESEVNAHKATQARAWTAEDSLAALEAQLRAKDEALVKEAADHCYMDSVACHLTDHGYECRHRFARRLLTPAKVEPCLVVGQGHRGGTDCPKCAPSSVEREP